MNSTIKLTTDQIFDLVLQMPPEKQQKVQRAIAEQAAARRAELRAYAENQFRKLSRFRGLDWDKMTDEDRIAFVDDLIHEDCECNQ